jgi:hypothetical protein
MIQKARQLLDDVEIGFIKSQIESDNPAHIKRALQLLCQLTRRGYRIRPDKLSGIEQNIVGLLGTRASDEKIRKWALNAIALIGRKQFCLSAVEAALRDFSNDPATMAAAIAAHCRLAPGSALTLLQKNIASPALVSLAALQHVAIDELPKDSVSLDIEHAPSELLKPALILVGLDRAPQNIFHPRFPNAQIVKVLGSHHEPIVSQYSVWAISENSALGFSDLGIDIKSIESQPPNVRSWVYRLIGLSPGIAIQHREYLALACDDSSEEARLGCALGLRDTFFDGLQDLTLDWFFTEPATDVRHGLMDHIVRNSAKCSSYDSFALEFYAKGERSTRLRMDASAVSTPLYGKFKKISLEGEMDLFRQGGNVTNNTYNFNGSIKAGAIAVGGNASNVGDTMISETVLQLVQEELTKAYKEVERLDMNPQLKSQVLEGIKTAQADPSAGKITAAVDLLKKTDEGFGAFVGTATSIATIINAICSAIGAAF